MNAAAQTEGHRAAQEIRSQPETWAAASIEIGRHAADGLPELTAFADVVFTGCGSTHYLAQWAAAHTRALHGIPATAVPASELYLNLETWVPRSPALLVAISRSAKTTETARAVGAFQDRGLGEVTLVTCAPEEPLAADAMWVLGTPSAMEETVPQTRSFTSMMLALSWLLAVAPDAGVIDAIAAEGRRLLSAFADGLPAAADPNTAYTFLGTGPRWGLASEAMLKIKEMSLSPSEAFQSLEFRHGPISTVTAQSLVVGLTPSTGVETELAVLDDVAELGAATALVGPGAEALAAGRHTPVAFDPELPVPWRDVLYLPAIHQTALAAATTKGLDPDRPSNLQAVVILDD